MSEGTTTVFEPPTKGRWMLPAPQWVCQDANGVTATVGAWSHLEAYRKGGRMLTDYLSEKADRPTMFTPPLAVQPKEDK